MSKVLFLNHSSVGHLNTLLNIAIQMKEHSHTVRFLIPGARGHKTGIQLIDTAFALPEMIELNEIAVDLMPPKLTMLLPAARLARTSGYREIQLAIDLFSQGITHYTRQILKVIETYKPDRLVTDFAFFASAVAAEAANLPYATVYHSGVPFRGAMIPPFGSGLPITVENTRGTQHDAQERRVIARVDRRIQVARQAVGLMPGEADVMRRPYSPWVNLVTSVEAIEAPRDNLTANTLYIGPCFGKRKYAQTDFPFDKLRNDKFKVYVSLGTVFNNKPKVYRRIIAGLTHLDYQIIISAGASYASLLRDNLPENVLVFKSVPQVDLLPKVDLVIGHGGNNSTNETLAAGKPLIVLPVGGEQGDNARRIEYLGTGLRLDIHSLTAADITQAVTVIRGNSTFMERAAALRTAIAETDGLQTAAACINWVIKHGQPLNRPPSFPLTITKQNLAKLMQQG
jgi:MGT family glycosyltransferase